MGNDIKNTVAKLIIVAWIATLVYFSLSVAKTSVVIDPNQFFGLADANRLSADVVKEIKVLLLMLSVSIIGGVSFIIKDFYKSVKYANIYDRAYEDYKSGNITHEGFQRLATVEIYSGRFNHTWTYWFLIQPILSITLGIIAFFIARSGLWVIQGTTADPDLSIRSIYMYAVFTFIAGFSSHKFIAWLDRLADKIFSTTLPEEKLEKKMTVENVAAGERETLKEELVGLSIIAESKASTLSNQPKSVQPSQETPTAKGKKSPVDEKPMKNIK